MPFEQLRILRKRLAAITVSLSFLMITSFGVSGYTLYISNSKTVNQRKELCYANNHTNKTLQIILLLARSIERHNTTTTPFEKRQAETFYNEALHKLTFLNCNKIG